MIAHTVLAVDPGRDKCGVAIVDSRLTILHRQVVATQRLDGAARDLVRRFDPDVILVGNGTFSREARQILEQVEGSPPLITVDERHTTERARLEYWRMNPPRGIWRLVPQGLRHPPEAYDDLAAYVMARDYLSGSRPPSNAHLADDTSDGRAGRPSPDDP